MQVWCNLTVPLCHHREVSVQGDVLKCSFGSLSEEGEMVTKTL